MSSFLCFCVFGLILSAKSEMTWSDIIHRAIFLFLTGPGIVGNSVIVVIHVYTFLMGPEKKPIDFILIQLALSNIIIICSTGVRGIAIIFYLGNFLDSVGCKIAIYLERVARGLSICNTCLLTVIQAVTISPKFSARRKFKLHTTWQILPCLLLFVILNLLISSNLLHYITAVSSMNKSVTGIYAGFCYMLPSRLIIKWLFLSLMALRDIVFQSLMGWSSGYMAFHLYKHHKCVLYLHKSRFSSSSSPEIRATQSTLVLMICFLFFYWVDFILSFYTGSTVTHDSTILYIKVFFGLGYAVLCPFVLVSRGVRATQHRRTH